MSHARLLSNKDPFCWGFNEAFVLFLPRIVCEMGKAEKSQYTGNVQVCVGVGECRPEFMAKSSKYYYFVVSLFLLLLDKQAKTRPSEFTSRV